ncbi:MAG: haloacid dehalogenase [Thermomicrobiales bacterium]
MSANSIRAAHRADFDEASELIDSARAMLVDLTAELDDFPSIYWSGYVRDAQKEFAEANMTLSMLSGGTLPSPEELGVEDAVYLNGLAECAGELRRHALDAMRRGELERAETALAIMDDIYGLLVTVDYPDAVTGGLRRSTDMARGVLERTRGDLTVALQQRSLAEALERAERRFASTQEARGSNRFAIERQGRVVLRCRGVLSPLQPGPTQTGRDTMFTDRPE